MVTFSVSAPRDPAPPPAGGAAQLLRALDTLEHSTAFFDRGGAIRHASAAFRAVVADPRLAGIEAEVRGFAAVLWGIANVRRLEGAVERIAVRAVSCAGGECRLRGAYVGEDLFGGGPSVLVGVEPPGDDPFGTDRLQRRFGLTAMQSRVARLLGEGLRNDEIARRLFISPHTARHHVEQIKLKVGGHTRAAVAARIRHPEA